MMRPMVRKVGKVAARPFNPAVRGAVGFDSARAVRAAVRVPDGGNAEGAPLDTETEWVEYYEQFPQAVSKVSVAAAAPEPQAPPVMERIGSGTLYALAVFVGGTLLFSIGNFWRKYNLTENRDRRKRLGNKDVVTTLSELLPSNRAAVTKQTMGKLRFKTGFTSTELFRKFLWYVLRDRQFNQDALDDLLHLKMVMDLSDDEVAEALRERAVRIEAKYGNLMLQTAGLSEKLVLKKATCRALFSKMLYLVENERVISPSNKVMNLNELRNIFGATQEDIEKLRILSLQEVDLDVLNDMLTKQDQKDAS